MQAYIFATQMFSVVSICTAKDCSYSTITLNVRVKPSDILEQLNDYSGMNIVYMNSIYARVLYILSRGTGRHFAELNGGS